MPRPLAREAITVKSVPFGVVRKFRDLVDVDFNSFKDEDSLVLFNAAKERFEAISLASILEHDVDGGYF
jgi:hypothetical protein